MEERREMKRNESTTDERKDKSDEYGNTRPKCREMKRTERV